MSFTSSTPNSCLESCAPAHPPPPLNHALPIARMEGYEGGDDPYAEGTFAGGNLPLPLPHPGQEEAPLLQSLDAQQRAAIFGHSFDMALRDSGEAGAKREGGAPPAAGEGFFPPRPEEWDQEPSALAPLSSLPLISP